MGEVLPLEAVGLFRSFGALAAVRDVHLALASGELHALIGPNGAGKTTLVNLVAGELAPDAGQVRLKGRDVTRLTVAARARAGLGRTFQVTSVLPGSGVLENAVLAAGVARPSAGFLADPMRDEALVAAAEAALGRVGLAELAGRRAGTLAHGQKRRLELAMALAAEPAVLLLDEPMAGLGPEESVRMARLLGSLKGGALSVLLVEHDMGVVFALADRVSVLVAGELVASGPPAAVRADPLVRDAYLGAEG